MTTSDRWVTKEGWQSAKEPQKPPKGPAPPPPPAPPRRGGPYLMPADYELGATATDLEIMTTNGWVVSVSREGTQYVASATRRANQKRREVVSASSAKQAIHDLHARILEAIFRGTETWDNNVGGEHDEE